MAQFDGSRPGPGRPKGSQNKLGRLARENIVQVFEKAGGIDSMVEWAKENRTEFYARVYTRLLPSEAYVTSTTDNRCTEEMTDEDLYAIIRACAAPDAQEGDADYSNG